ncbi:MAG: hypothetical protein SOZ80_00140 [Prevotella sp.]|uniref:hypothetical protein n=1 Tax=Prevotella sp. TaxID=59823 RepID=UPI002A309A53|nr:hypothetical protein [Prevotella sp.]MDD7317484.1 hypothetical protein [Prevotellaceae bacterium]MDY4019180.1 hypothetical protein [Prevotella sp.]
MRKLTKTESVIMVVGAVLMAVAAVAYVLAIRKPAAWVMIAGTGAFVAMQMRQTYDGYNLTIRRLRSIMTVGNIFFVLAALLMLENAYRFLLPKFMESGISGYNAYVHYIHNNWVVALLIAAVIELYTTHRISSELDKEAKKL